jgi:hypothetical protein
MGLPSIAGSAAHLLAHCCCMKLLHESRLADADAAPPVMTARGAKL